MEIQEEIDRCVASLDWVASAAIADVPGHPCLLVHTRYRPDGRELSYYIRFDGAEGVGSAFSILENELPNPSNPRADEVDRVLGELAGMNGIERLRFDALSFDKPVARLALPGIGDLTLEVRTGMNVRMEVRRKRDAARMCANRRRISTMSLFGIATVATDARDARMLVETAMAVEFTGSYRGIATTAVPSKETISLSVVHGCLEIDEKAIHLRGVPDTVGNGICGRGARGRVMSTLVDHPAMRLLVVRTAEWDDGDVRIEPCAWKGRRMAAELPLGRAKDVVQAIMEAAHGATA